MGSIRKEIEHPFDRKNAHDLYSKYMALALGSRTKGDRVLFENYYQRAEYYLHLMNKLTIWPGEAPDKPKLSSFKEYLSGRNQRRHLSPKRQSKTISVVFPKK